MAATITPKQFKKQLKADFPQFIFKSGPKFAFRPPKTIVLGPEDEKNYPLLALHEVGHALSGHNRYHTHVERIRLESEAWVTAEALSQRYHIPFDKDFAESQLDTYRDWLHAKSACPACGLTRFQDSAGAYHCPHCDLLV